MGGSSGFCKAVQKHVQPFNPIEFNTFIVDASYAIHYILGRNPRLAYNLFCASPQGSSRSVILEFKKHFQDFLFSLNATSDNSTIVFEDTSPKSDSRRMQRARTRARILNKSLRRLKRPGSKHSSMKAIAKVMGRPPLWIVKLLIKELEDSYSCVLVPTGKQADDYIAREAIRTQARPGGQASIAVIGNDRDFLVYSQGDCIKGLVYKMASNTMQLLKKDVVETFNQPQDSYKLPAAYFLGGCDDNPWKIKGIGFGRALTLVKSSTSIVDLFEKLAFKADEDDLKILERGQESSLTSEIVQQMKDTFLNLLHGKTFNFIL